MAKATGSYGYEYYNKKKPRSYMICLYESNIQFIDIQIKKMEIEKEKIIAELK
jgi:hypothetical protein